MAPSKQRRIHFVGLAVSAAIYLIYLIIRWTGSGCEDHETVSDFDVESYMGLWYEFARSASIPFETGECITAQYSLKDSREVKVTNTQYFSDTDKFDSIDGKAYCSKFNTGSCGVKFNALQPAGAYDVVATDYNTYAIVYSCSAFFANAFCLEYLWILSRQAYDEDSAEFAAFKSQASAMISEKLPNFDQSTLRYTSQDASACKWVEQSSQEANSSSVEL